MGLLDAFRGNATEMDMADLQKELEELLISGEKVQKGYKVLRDYFVFTDKRLILVDKQGLTGNKVQYHSIPYKSIRQFSVETAGTLDVDSELKIWIAGSNMPLEKKFGKKASNIFDVQKALAEHLL